MGEGSELDRELLASYKSLFPLPDRYPQRCLLRFFRLSLTWQIGRQMTVEYFSESEAAGREGVPSLRFPRIKTIWEEKRDI